MTIVIKVSLFSQHLEINYTESNVVSSAWNRQIFVPPHLPFSLVPLAFRSLPLSFSWTWLVHRGLNYENHSFAVFLEMRKDEVKYHRHGSISLKFNVSKKEFIFLGLLWCTRFLVIIYFQENIHLYLAQKKAVDLSPRSTVRKGKEEASAGSPTPPSNQPTSHPTARSTIYSSNHDRCAWSATFWLNNTCSRGPGFILVPSVTQSLVVIDI